MSEKFDYALFEKLSGLPVANYTISAVRSGNIPSDFMDYFRMKSNEWDGQHLELGIYVLGKINSTEAIHEIANYITHPIDHVRSVAVQIVAGLNQIDSWVMAKVVEALARQSDAYAVGELRSVLTKAATDEARTIAKNYMAKGT